MMISPHGCVDTVRGIVRVEENFSFYVPNSFTPNGDGVNDMFRGYGVAINSYQMNIYNRWGELIYTTNNYDKPWDGAISTDDVQNDVFVYHIALVDQHGEKHTYVGDVSVIR
jgi:gliding motility-associated-like protein